MPTIPNTFEISSLICDPSKGKKSSDYVCLAFVGVSQRKVWTRILLERIPREQLIANYIDWYYIYQPTIAGIESNSFQDLYCDLINNECHYRNIAPIAIHEMYNTVNKEIRIRRIGPYLRDDKLRVISPVTWEGDFSPTSLSEGFDINYHLEQQRKGARILYKQLRDFPNGTNDDGPDTLEMGIRLIQQYTSGNQQTKSHESQIVTL